MQALFPIRTMGRYLEEELLMLVLAVLVMGLLQFVKPDDLDGVLARISGCIAEGGVLVHRETRTPAPWVKEYVNTTGPEEVRSYYRNWEQYREAFDSHGLQFCARRSILPPNLLYSVYSRFKFEVPTGTKGNGTLPAPLIKIRKIKL